MSLTFQRRSLSHCTSDERRTGERRREGQCLDKIRALSRFRRHNLSSSLLPSPVSSKRQDRSVTGTDVEKNVIHFSTSCTLTCTPDERRTGERRREGQCLVPRCRNCNLSDTRRWRKARPEAVTLFETHGIPQFFDGLLLARPGACSKTRPATKT